ncbi:MAG: hypothetical protein CMJ48_06470 [Planctomycetaceae bacterium]|nr:hypothetical protein [Planctomycetaceae bacterium]
MLTLNSGRRSRKCDGSTRRDFLKVGALGCGLTLPGLLRARAAESGSAVKNTSVVWVWLGGGPTHIETFDPKMTAPVEYRSVSGEVATKIPGVTLGGHFPEMAQVADKMTFVRSFAHTNSGHGGGTHFVMTGYDNRLIDAGGLPSRPSMGSIAARVRGANHRVTGMPTYIRLNGISSDGPAFLGTAYAPFGTSGEARRNMALRTPLERVDDRRQLRADLDRFRKEADQSGLMEGLDAFEKQAFNLVLGEAPKAFDLKHEDPKTVKAYGNGLGQQLLIARRLCEAGCGFVTMQYGGWDMHGKVLNSMKSRGTHVDHAVATFVQDLSQRGMLDDVLLVITGEFGRTPKINRNAGRDHWAPLSTLALAGGGLPRGVVVGESMPKADIPKTAPIRPQDLMATVFDVLGIDRSVRFMDQAGRPNAMLESGKPISRFL